MTGTEWTAPTVERVEAANIAPERQAVEELLEFHRATFLHKCAGLTGVQLAQRGCPPSTLSLLGLVRHLAEVERSWFRRRVAEEDIGPLFDGWDVPFDDVDPARAQQDFATYYAEVDAARAIQAARDLDDTFTPTFSDGGTATIDIRALLLHMVEEYARHNGHADLLRQAVDGETGE